MNGPCDPHGRPLRDLRISVTRECQLACTFCHHEGTRPGPQEMTPEEIGRIVAVGARLGVRSVKLTGGEPLLREDLPDIVRAIRPSVDEISLVTNGHMLGERATELLDAGLDRANVSVHTLDPDTYRLLTRTTGPPMESLVAAQHVGLPIKANMVVTRATEDQARPFIEWAQRTGTDVQLIELHGPPEEWPRLKQQYVPLDGLEAWLGARSIHKSVHRLHGRPCYHLPGAKVELTRPMHNWRFCQECKRLRLTADGRFQTCLLRPLFVDALPTLRSGHDDEDLERLYGQALSLREPTWTRPVDGQASQEVAVCR